MSEADRVFARMIKPGSHTAPEDTQLLQIKTRRRGAVAGQSRTVEVVHRKSDRAMPASAPARPPVSAAHAATWDERFPARHVAALALAADPPATPAPSPPVVHVMPGWEPLLPPVTPTMAPLPPLHHKTAKAAPSALPKANKRAFADPFDAEDTGANCIRCGYLVSPARERRALTTCARCD
jgi:hypothetical protein